MVVLLSLCTICNFMHPDDRWMMLEMIELLLHWAEVFLALKIPSYNKT
jgi:hypothetical protein